MNQKTVDTQAEGPAKLVDSVYVVKQTFDGMTVRGTVVIGSRRALIFDTLVFPQKTAEVLPLCSDRELLVVYSHADWDHVWGTCGLSPAQIIAHEECAKRFTDRHDVQKTLSDYRAKYGNDLAQVKLVPPQQTFASSLTLDLGGITVELRHCPGHTKDSIVAIVPERSLLLAADCIEAPLPLLNEDSDNLLNWIQTLSELQNDARISTCVPSHGEIAGRELLSNNIGYLKSLLSNESPSLFGLDDFYALGHQENRVKAAALRDQGVLLT